MTQMGCNHWLKLKLKHLWKHSIRWETWYPGTQQTWYSYWLAVNLPIYPPIVGKIEILHAKYFCLNQINIFHFNCFKFIWVQVMQLSGSFDHINHLWSHFSLSPPSNWTETPTIWLGILELTGSRSVIGQLSLILIYYCLVMIVY